ncbi:hypothetical protein P7C70_g4654, partial [Phenoliferia sp. Uapishka_3]
MAAAKSFPSVASLGDTHRGYENQGPLKSSSASSSQSFRTQQQQESGNDSDFGRFASTSPPTLYNSLFPRSSETSSSPSAPQSQAQAQDGADVLALLSPSATSSLADTVHGDWAQELSASQSQPWKIDQETAIPRDPLISTSPHSDNKGKGKAVVTPTSGSTTPTSLELLSSISSLDLKSKRYLQSLLAGSPETSIQSYLTHGSYSDDIYGLPDQVKRLLDKARSGEGEREEGRAKAVKRLTMVMRHLWGEGQQASLEHAQQDANILQREKEDARAGQQPGTGPYSRRDTWASELMEEMTQSAKDHDLTSGASTLASTRNFTQPSTFSSESYQPLSAVREAYHHSLSGVPHLHPGQSTTSADAFPEGGDWMGLEANRVERVGGRHRREEASSGEEEREVIAPFQDFLKTRLISMGGSLGL